jgi:hypothetical protein
MLGWPTVQNSSAQGGDRPVGHFGTGNADWRRDPIFIA